jgi:hypothetical protein
VSRRRPSRWLYLLAALLVVGGAAPIAVLVVRPLAAEVVALGYQETSCTIETAHVATRFDSDGDPIHSIDVLYSYEVGGTRFQSRRYDLWRNQKGDARRIVATLQPGHRMRCFYDPDRPAEAVVDRRLDANGLVAVLALLPIAFGVQLGRSTWRRRHWLGRERRRHIELIGARPRRLALRRLGVTLATRLAAYGAFGPALLALSLHDRGGILGQLLRGELPILPAIWVVILTVPEGPYRGAQVVDALAPRGLMAKGARRFQLRAPLAPPSFRGKLVRLSWRLELRVDSASTRRPLVIAPARVPLELP